MEWEWDKESNLVKLTDVHGHVTEYTYYNDNRLYQVIIKRPPAADRIFTYSYDAAGRLLEIQYPSGTNLVARFTNSMDTSGSGWDANGNLLHLRYLQSSTLLQGFAYAYDDSGNRTQLPSNPLNEVTWDYGYDWINRLTSVDRNTVTHSLYSYDDRDNRLYWDQPVATDLHEYSVAAHDLADQIQDRSLNSTVVETFTHDDDGNMISRTLVAGPDTTDYRRNDDDQLTRIQLPTSAEEVYRYDADGIRKYTDNTTSYFSSGGTSVAETNPGGNVSYIQGHVLLGLDLAGTFYYYLTDGLSSVRLIVDASGSEVASFLHNEFGMLEAATGSSTLRAHTYVGGSGVRNETGFSGLYYMRQRWYEPSLGRFLRQDPIGFSGGLNLYTYVGQNPVNRVDPSGLAYTNDLTPWQMEQIDAGIQEIRDQGFALEADLLSRNVFGSGNGLPAGTAAMTSPSTDLRDVIWIKTCGPDSSWKHVDLTMLLFHEAQHLKQKFLTGDITDLGIRAHWFGDSMAKYNLEFPAYSTEHRLRDAWWPSATAQERIDMDRRVDHANKTATALRQDAGLPRP